jgi:YbgC/YbaW family acyl-CoA thioester hydrolase
MTETRITRSDFRFFHRRRVRWAEVDMQKIVFNIHYLTYFDTARSDYWRALAFPHEETMQMLGGDLFMRKSTVEFNGSARLDDVLDIGIKCARVGNSSILIQGGMFLGDELLATCELVYVYADPATQTSKPVPPALRGVFMGYEAGEPMFDVVTGSWNELGEDAGKLRRAVFVDEQRIPEELEWDAHDATALHAIARNRLGQAIATGRLVAQSPGVGRIGRMAVHRVLRDGGYGKAILRALEAAAAARGEREVVLHAQRNAEAFYARLGYAPCSEPFEEAGIAHIEMRRSVAPPLAR